MESENLAGWHLIISPSGLKYFGRAVSEDQVEGLTPADAGGRKTERLTLRPCHTLIMETMMQPVGNDLTKIATQKLMIMTGLGAMMHDIEVTLDLTGCAIINVGKLHQQDRAEFIRLLTDHEKSLAERRSNITLATSMPAHPR